MSEYISHWYENAEDDCATCPYCGTVNTETSDYPDGLQQDGDIAWFSCGHCAQDYTVMLHVSYEFEAVEVAQGPRQKRHPGLKRHQR